MLRLKNIKKDYEVADTKVHALKGISLSFRKNEFVSILGPSGCGKTTMLNIIGGLDKYTDGDLYINGRSTKEFTDRDWDIYRNHRIGFIFQSYNLIPHQTILGNVELALTIAGIDKETRTAKAKAALDKVGLKDQYNKKPNQLSGGQCQRVAIARALVNEPEILLADEPTGALDTETSIQIMELIKEVSKDKLVIMVTHNPDLARTYSTRIISLLDGEVLNDSNPFSEKDEIAETSQVKKLTAAEKKMEEKAQMNWWTAFKLSFRNLLSKKKRTILTSIAGSIGIIGVATVISVSTGVKGYIASMEDDMLSGYPVTIAEESLDLESILGSMSTEEKAEVVKEMNKVGVRFVLDELMDQYSQTTSMMTSNTITKDYIDYVSNMSSEYAACIDYGYGVDFTNNIFTDFKYNAAGDYETDDYAYGTASVSSVINTYSSVLQNVEGIEDYSDYITGLVSTLQQAPDNTDYVLSQYDVLSGKIATEKDEIMIVVNSDSQLTDLVLAELGYYNQDEFIKIAKEAKSNPGSGHSDYKTSFDYDELLNHNFYYYPNDSVYTEYTVMSMGGTNYPIGTYLNKTSQMGDTAKAAGMKLKVVGILSPKEDINYGCLSSGVYYTSALTKYALNESKTSAFTEFVKDECGGSISSMNYTIGGLSMDFGISYDYNYIFEGTTKSDKGYIGQSNQMASMMSMVASAFSQSFNIPNPNTLTLRMIGGDDLANSISIYPVDFDLKDKVTEYLDAWNQDGDLTYTNADGNTVTIARADREDIKYTDTVGVLITMINTLINIVTYALIAFVALSLVVSCFMIAIITYVSVLERVKEIGVIRSLGGRKKDVNHLFNAETFMIGLTSGIIGVAVTYILELVINLVIGGFTGIYSISNLLPWQALLMVVLSIALTVVSGLIPARGAAKQDPVNALRSE